jgi:CHAT domain-containing protein/tetratricopeptide (TPR) repeat protein
MNNKIIGWRGSVVASLATFCLIPISVAQESRDVQSSVRQAEELNEQIDKLTKEGQYASAIPIAQKAVALSENTLGPLHPVTATALNTLGKLYRITGDYAKAEPLLQRGLAIREKTLGPEHPDTANSLHNLGALFYVRGLYSKAELLYQRSLAIREKSLGSEHPDTAASLNNLALIYADTGAYDKAEPLYERAIAIREKVQGPTHPDTAGVINNLALLYVATGAYTKAEPLWLSTLEIREKVLGPEHPDTASALNNLALLYSDTGAYSQAEPLFQRALATRVKSFGWEHPDTAMSLNNLACLYLKIGAYTKAEPLFLRAMSIQEKALGPESPSLALFLDNLAHLYAEMGDYSQAEPLYKRTLSIREKIFGSEHPETAETLYNLASMYMELGTYDTAETLYLQALTIREKALGPQHPYTALTTGAIATLSWAQGKSEKALKMLERTQSIQSENSERFLLSGSESRKQAYIQALVGDTYRNVSFSMAVPSRESVVLGLTSVIQYKGRVLDAMSNSMAQLRSSVRANDQEMFEQLAMVANQFSTLTYRGPGNLTTEAYRKRLTELSIQQERLETNLSTRSLEFRHQIAPITVNAVRRAIPQDAVLVELYRYLPADPRSARRKTKPQARYVAYLLKRDIDPLAIDLGEAQVIETLVQNFHLAVSDPTRNDVKASAAALSEKLLKPLRVYLQHSDQLLISPDGALNLVPMSALLDERGEYMAKRFEITYLTSARDLLRNDSRLSASSMIIANPDFGNDKTSNTATTSHSQRSTDMDRSGLIFRPLPNTALEAQTLKGLLQLDDKNVLLKLDATEASLKQLHGPHILHVASHGFFLSDQELASELQKRTSQGRTVPIGENPLLRSGIALAGANARRSGENDDGILTALEVAQLDLHGTELVVLSACDSGVGDVQNGEGVYGLRRALVLAGAQTQITSLWKVADEATRMLMIDYYQRLLKGEGRSAALRHAQLAMLANKELSHPYYWASFFPIGNWTPLSALH